MSSRARRLVLAPHVEPFDWNTEFADPELDLPAPPAPDPLPESLLALPPAPAAAAAPAVDVAAIERDAFTKGYAQGERAGDEAAAARGAAMVRRLAQTVEDLGALRADMIRKSERQLVQLAIAIANRVIHREISLNRELIIAMARVALERLGDVSSATIRLHPDDFVATASARNEGLSTELVRVVADPSVQRGGCMVESDFGLVDLSVTAQVGEIANALLGADGEEAIEDDEVAIAS